MLELIFQGFVEWNYGMALECWQYFSSALLNIMGMNFAYLKAHIPVLPQIQQILLAAGWALLLGNLAFQALKSMATGLGFEGEDPKLLFTRTFVFSFLLMASPQICDMGLNLTQIIINYLEVPDAVNITFADESVFSGLTAAWLLVVICGFIIMFKVFKLILEIAERYIILAILTLCAPLAFGMGGSRNTSDIFTGWCRMFASMCFVMVTNIIFFKMLLSVLSFVPSGLDVLPWMVLVFGIVKVAKKIDAIITRIGLNPAITGDGLGGRSFPGMLTYAVMRAVGQQVANSAGKSMGGKGRSGGTAPPSGGGPNGPRTGPAPGGAHFANPAGTGGRTAGTTVQSSQQVNAAQNTQMQGGSFAPDGANQEPAAQFGGPNTDIRQQSASASSAGGIHSRTQNTVTGRSRPSRQTSVAPGKRRGASHVPNTALSGMAGMGRTVQAGLSAGRTAGMRSGAAGTGQPGIGTPADYHGSPDWATGTAGNAPAQPTRFTAVSMQQVNEGGADSRMMAAEQNQIFMAAGGQARGAARSSGLPAAPPRQASDTKQGPGTTRFTARQTETAHSIEKSTASSARAAAKAVSALQSAAPAAASKEPAAIHPQGTGRVLYTGGAVRYGRNDLPSEHAGRPGEHSPRTAQQERSAIGASQMAKAASPVSRPGTAGMAARTEQVTQTRQTAQKKASASKSTPSTGGTAGGRRPSSGAPARQERRRADGRSGDQTPRNGGVTGGK